MANVTGNIQPIRAEKNVIRIDLFDRYEVTTSGDGVKGAVYLPKGTTLAPGETVTLTRA